MFYSIKNNSDVLFRLSALILSAHTKIWRASSLGRLVWRRLIILKAVSALDFDLMYSGVPDQGELDEEVTELYSGHYVERSAWEEKEYNDEPLPDGARLINREISGGNYVIFSKSSYYNQEINNYAGEHNTMEQINLQNTL